MATRGRLVDVVSVDGFVADDNGEWLGYAGYEISGDAMEVVSLEALTKGRGAATALLAACLDVALERGARRVWLITTNDNIEALRFCQRRGFVLVAVHRDAVTRARETVKLELPRANWPEFVDHYAWPT